MRASISLVPLAAIVAGAPRYLRGVSCGHDFDFHFISWLEVRRSWSEGVFYPHWATSPNWGAGEARFVFYPPLTWMLGAAGSFLVKWEWLPGVLTVLFLMCSGLATRALAREFLPPPAATLAGVLATCTPYALFSAYERTAFAELAAGAWIPLLLLFALRQRSQPGASLFRQSCDGSAVLLSLALAATWLTNAPAGVMGSYLLAFTALVAAIVLRSWWPVLRAVIGAVLGLGLAAFYLVPAVWEQRWVAISQALDVGMRIQDSWLFARNGASGQSGIDMELHYHVLLIASAIVVFTTVLAAAGLLVSVLRKRLPKESGHIWLPIALLIPVIFLLQLPLSAAVWSLLPRLQFLQFPWRLLVVLAVPAVVFAAAATPLGSRAARWWSALAWTTAILLCVGVSTVAFFQYCDEEDNVPSQLATFQAGSGVEGIDEYAALAADNSKIASGLPDGCLVTDPMQELGETDSDAAPMWFAEQGSCDEVYSSQLWQAEHKLLRITPDHDGFLILRLRRYPAWQVTVNGNAVSQPPISREDGLMAVPVSAGQSTIEIRWATTQDEVWGRWISLGTLTLLLTLAWLERKTRAVHLS